ncbi:MAG: AMP-binding protein, partial [Lautropia sp.]
MPTSRPAAATLAHLLEEQASRRPNSPALFHAGRQYSYGELQAAARSVAKSLLELDVRRGDRVAAWLGNQPEWLSMCLGAAYVGAVFVPLNTWYKRTELEWTLTHCGVSVLVSLGRFLKQDFAAMLSEALGRQRFPMLRTIALLDGALPGALSWREFLAAGQRRSDADVRTALTAVRSDDPLFILYTSGSTAEPKGVVLAHGGVVGNGFDMGERRFVVADDRVWIGSPLFYGLGATNALPVALTHCASIVLQGAFEAGAALEVIESTEATVYYGTGNMT